MDARAPMRMGLLAFILVMMAVLAILLLNMVPLLADVEPVAPQRRVVRSIVTSVVPLEDAGRRAATRAQAWSPDATLVRVEGTWDLVPGWEQVKVPPIAWSFYYYSGANRELAAVVVDDDELLWVPPFPIPITPRALTTYPPPYGVEETWLTFLAAGGNLFLRQHDDAQVHFRLHSGTRSVIWTVSAFDTGDYVRILIDPRTGEVLAEE
jgi:hypothetical protein